MKPIHFEKFAGACGFLAGLSVFLFAVSFFGIESAYQALGVWLSGLFLMLTGFFLTVLLIGIYARLRETDAAYALWGMLIGFFGAIAVLIDGSYTLAAAISSPGSSPSMMAAGAAPSAADPRGLLSLGLLGISFFIVSWLVIEGGQFPRAISYWGYVTAIAIVYLFIARLIIVNPTYLSIMVPALAAGFILLPGWYMWLGIDLMRGLVDEHVKSAKTPDLYCCSV